MNKNTLFLYGSHIFNDGYKASILLLLPFIAKQFHLNLTTVGFLAMVVNSTTLFLALPTGYLSGKFGGIKVLSLSMFIYGIGFCIIAATKTPYFFPIAFLLTGIGFGAYHTISFALVARTSVPEKRGKIMSEFSTMGELGRIGLASLVTTLASWLGWAVTAVIFGISAVIAASTAVAAHVGKDAQNHIASKNESSVRFQDIAKDKNFLVANSAGILDVFASGSLYIFIPFLLVFRHAPLSLIGFITATFFFGSIAGKMVLGSFIDKYGNEKIFIISEIAMAVLIVVLSYTPNVIGIAITTIILGVFTKGTAPIVQTMVSKTLESHGNFEKGFALNNLTQSLANLAAPITLGFIADHMGIIAAFNIAAVFAILAIVPALGLRWMQRQSVDEKLILAKSE